MPAATENDIWLYIYVKHEARFCDLKRYFVDKRKIANQTFINYLTNLQKDEKIEKTYNKRLDAIVYFVPEKAKGHIGVLMDNLEFDRMIDIMSGEEAKEMLKELLHGTI